MKRNTALLVVVFITGAVVLVTELVGMRMLAPYFGNTLYSTTSILTVILAALSVGYYFGGRFADQKPTLSVLFSIIAASGIILYISSTVSQPILNFTTRLSLETGSLLSGMTLFFIPNVLLGMVSPYVVKIRSLTSQNKAGTNAGDVFFASTVGSIVGSLLTGFFLIPRFGLSNIFKSACVILILIGVIGLFLSKKKITGLIFLLLMSVSVLFSFLLVVGADPRIILSKDGTYQKLVVFDTQYKGRPVRVLSQDLNESSAIFLDGDDLVFDYTKYIEVIPPDRSIKNALVIGAGSYTIPKYLSNTYPNIQIDVLDIEQGLDQIARSYFKLSSAPNIHTIVEDGRRYLSRSDVSYDLVYLDAYSSVHSVPQHLVTSDFFRLLRSRVSEGGIIMGNLIGRLDPHHLFIYSMQKTLANSLPGSDFYMMDERELTQDQNFIFIWSRDFSFQSSVQRHKEKNLVVFEDIPTDAVLLTDDFSPVEYLVR
jgi:predicted membrane-bound spermidine synthase